MKPIKGNFSVDEFFSLSEAESDKWIKKITKQRGKILASEDLDKIKKTVAKRAFKVALDCLQMGKRVARDRERRAAS